MDCKVEFFSKYVFLKFKDQKKKSLRIKGIVFFRFNFLP